MKQSLKDFLIPHEGNDFAPHSLQKLALGLMALLVLLTFAITNLQSILWISSDWLVSTVLPAVVIQETNQERSAQSLGLVVRNATLDQAAQLKAEHMAKESYFAHYSPEGVSPWFWFGQVGYNFVHAGENLAVHFSDSSEVVAAWMASPTHRANILNTQYQEIGIGVAKGEYEGFDTVFVVQLFGTPAAPVAVTQAPTPVVAAEATTTPTTATPAPAAADESVVLAQAEEMSSASEQSAAASTAGADASVTASSERTQAPVATLQLTQIEASTTLASSDESALTILPASTTPPNTSYFSSLITTSTNATPLDTQFIGATEIDSAGFARIGTQPHTVLQFVYTLLASMVVVALGLSVFIEVRRQQPVQLAYAFLLLFMLGGLWYTHLALTGGALIV